MCLKSANESGAEIRRIAARDTIVLRDATLRPDLPPGGSHYPGDEAPETLHLGAFSDNTLVAVATLCREAMPGVQSTTSWRLRGMATLPEYRSRGLGRQLAQRCFAYAAEQGGICVWCTSRVATVAFYRTLGFTECSDPFSLPEFSDALYIRMRRPLY
ncbi:MAG TPA: GNAT family N-acetyltransferase [Acidobacteriaceae bacterium]|nr:GNAT family N-acetyltransferase [Acidobacteriaceae bacterium]